MSKRRRGRGKAAGKPGSAPGGEAAPSGDAGLPGEAQLSGESSPGDAVGHEGSDPTEATEPETEAAGVVLDDDGNPVIPDAGPRPPLMVAAVVLTLAQAGLLLVWAVLIWIEVLGRAGDGPIGSGVSLGVFLAGFGAALVGVAIQFWRGMRWARSATVAWQLTSGVAGIAMATTGVPAGLLVLIPNLAVLVCIFSPRALTWFERQLTTD